MATIDYKQKIKDYMNSSEVDTLYKSMLINLFPELKESEDEKTLKEIKQFIRSRGMSLAQSKVDSWIAWLEKQGEHANFINKIQIGDKVTRNEDGILVNLSQLNRVAKKDEKQSEQKHQYNSRPRYVGEEELLGTNKQEKCPFLKQELIDMGFAFTQDGDLAYPIHKIENKESAAWSEDDERILNGLISSLARIGANTRTDSTSINYTFSKEIDWLKSFKDRVQPQPKQEWSEEDEKILSNIIKDLVHPWNEYIPDRIEDEIKWLKNKLKSLRHQSQWKPSDAQMESIRQAVSNMKNSACYDSVLVHLLRDLEKLK